jgi:hypothetical protein
MIQQGVMMFVDDVVARVERDQPPTGTGYPRSLRYGVGQKLKGGNCKGVQVGEPLSAAGLERSGPLDGTSDRKTSVAGWIAVAISNRSGRAGFTQAPSGGEACLHSTRKQDRVRLGGRPKLRECGFV